MSITASNLELLLKAAVAVAAIIAVILCIVFVKKKGAGPVSKTKKIINSVISVILIGIIVAANVATSIYSSSLDSVFTKPADGSDSITTTEEDWNGLVTEIADEGMVLLENKDNTLPLAEGTKINLLGYCAYNPHYSGSGSGSVDGADAVSIVSSLETAGFELNENLVNADIFPDLPEDTNPYGWNDGDIFLGDPSIDTYSGDISFESQKEYSDTAVVVLGRGGGEGYDLTQYTEGDALALSDEEKDLLSKATESFGTVVVVLNCANAMELDELSGYDIDALVWSGVPGPYGFASLGSILNGTVNPSGSLVDTWVYDNDSNPVMETFGENQASNSDTYYIDYIEGIYVGYKWYETAYAESAVIKTEKTGKTFDFNDYDSIVAYPFGYGLSYTTFEQKFVSSPKKVDPNGTVSFDVEVTNTGDVAGKDAVQIYVTAPYTDYDKANGIEKSAISLIGIAKTGVIEPGASETVTVTANVEDFASYDVSHKNDDGTTGSYMLDAGKYAFVLGDNAHTAYDTAKATLEEDYFYSGENKRSSDETAASNQFDEVARGLYLSRQDAFANYADVVASVSDEVKNTTWETSGSYDESLDDVVDYEYEEGVDYAVSGDLTVEDVKGLDYDDPKWDELVKQMTVDELFELGSNATYQSIAIDSIGKSATTDSDGPLGISSMFNAELNSIAYPCIPLLAATFNVDLAQKFGEIVSDQAHSKGVTGWYAPAMDIHRSPYSGRNFEYFSEDGTLSALMAQSEVAGAREKGMMAYIKHFALNDQETQRSGGLHTYAYEQAIREIFLKPFEASVKNGGANCVMTSMNFVGDTYAAASVSLVTNVLRNEWGFRGKSLTDMDERNEASIGYDACLRAGTDAWLSVNGIEKPSDITSAEIYYLQRAAKNILYAEGNSETYAPNIVNWHLYVIILSIELAIITILLLGSVVLNGRKKK